MSKRIAKFLSAVFASFLAATPLATIPHNAARAADDCLAGPKKDQTPQGGHWYYRIDHATKRHCWYLGEEREKLSQISRPNSSPSTKPASPNTEPALQPSVADARAELPARTRIEQPNAFDALAPAMPEDAASAEANDVTRPPDAETQRSIVATRWPDSYSATPMTNAAPAKRDANVSASPVARVEPASVLAAEPFAAADASSASSAYSVPVQLAAMLGALALAGIIGSLVFKFASTRRPVRTGIRKRRGAIWERTNTDSGAPSAYPVADIRARRPDFSRGSHHTGDPDDRVADFYAQLSKLTPS